MDTLDDLLAHTRTRLLIDEITSVALVDKGADPEATILFFKRAAHTKGEHNMELQTPKVRDIAGGVIQKLADDIRKANPTLSPAAARVQARKTPAGQDWSALERDPDAHLPVIDWHDARKRRLAKGGSTSAAAEVDRLATKLRESEPALSQAAARAKVRYLHRDLAAREREEQRA